jgi:glycosyltransferase involved in cell wall biosynthesis
MSARILYVQPSELLGGAERQAAALLPRLQAQGLEVTALVGPGRTIMEWLQAAGVQDIVHSTRFPRDWADSHGLQRLALAREFVHQAGELQAEIEELIDDRGIQAVVAAMAFSWISATPAARRKCIPVIWRAGGTELSRPQRLLLPLWARRHAPDALVCNSEAVRKMFAPLVPAPAVIVRNGVDTDLFHPGAGRGTELRPAWAKQVVGFAGRLVPQKRPEDFVAMAAQIAPRYPEVAFLMAGAGSRQAHFQAMASDLGLGHRLQFLGVVEDMRAFYAACDVLVLPSRSEGCPNIVLEAMAMKLPVVASDTDATREVVSPWRDGLLFPTGEVDRLVDLVQQLLEAPALRARLATRALRKVRASLSAEASARSLARVVWGLLDHHPGLQSSRAASAGVVGSPG